MQAGPTLSEVKVGLKGLDGFLRLPRPAAGIVVFAHGSGSGRFSPRNNRVADALGRAGLASLLFDLLTPEEAEARANVFDVGLLASRLVMATTWLSGDAGLPDLPIGYFGASTGAAAALLAAASLPDQVAAVVSRGGRPDLAGGALADVRAPTLLIVGGLDGPVIDLNRQALELLGAAEKELVIVPGAGHLFEETGTLDEVVRLAADWFGRHLPRGSVG